MIACEKPFANGFHGFIIIKRSHGFNSFGGFEETSRQPVTCHDLA